MRSNTSLSNYAKKRYLSLYWITQTSYRPSMILPALDHAAHHSQQWVTPELGLNSTEQGIPRLGRDNMKLHSTTGRISSKELLTPIDHKLSFPTCLSHPRSIHLHCHSNSPLVAKPPFPWASAIDRPEFSEICGSYKTPSRSSHFLCAFSHLERVTHRHDNLLLQPKPPL